MLTAAGAAAGAAVALCWLEQWGRLARRNSGGRVGSVGLGSVGGPDAGTGGDLRLLLAAPVRPQHCRACRCLQRDHCVAFFSSLTC